MEFTYYVPYVKFTISVVYYTKDCNVICEKVKLPKNSSIVVEDLISVTRSKY